ncbi:GGDEF domain-containing protein [Janthinobacterium sp. 17J80-10]|uniref:GGDEF domain-containing protein n=1 Tax=Janthinobacterium sp. 17J80-10 TaxID=2497863 RepID=UPI0013E8D877|nr:GGDEF domain-containing protein [Janthinobacterium sp. 17J80-10]
MPAQAATMQSGDTLRQRYETIELRRQALLLYLGNAVASIFLFGFGVANLVAERHLLAWFTLVHGGITLANIVLFRVTGNRNWASYGFTYGLLALFGFLVATGGVDHTGPLWGYPMAVVALSILRARFGLAVIAAMLGVILVLFLAPPAFIEIAAYSAAFKLRYTATFLALVLFTGLHEFARAKSQGALEQVSEQIDRLSQTDVLTDLPNRRYMLDRLEEENSRYLRHQHPYAILYGDVDDFKQINDRYGHAAGDEALRAIAHAMRTRLRQHDIVCRWGGEEFLVLLPETGAELALEVAEKLRAAIAAIEFQPGGIAHRLSISFGVQVASVPDTVDNFIHQADQKLYRAKQAGKNRALD